MVEIKVEMAMETNRVLSKMLDGDGVADEFDICEGHDDSIDLDNDLIPDGCDSLIDSDDDGVEDLLDACEGHNDTIDIDGDGIPYGCDDLIDSDGDGVADGVDECANSVGYVEQMDAPPLMRKDWRPRHW